MLLAGLLLLLGGCSTVRLAYLGAPELSYWWLDSYLDFNSRQSPQVHEALHKWFRWHRSTQLGTYAALLARARAQAIEPATAAQACRWFDDANALFDVAFEHAVPPLAEVLPSLTPQQLQHLARKYGKINDEMADDFLQESAEARQQASMKRILDRVETLYGKLDASQRTRVAGMVAQSPFDPALWLTERKQRQQDVLQTLRRLNSEHPAAAEAQAALRTLVQNARRSPNDAYHAYQQRLLQYNCAIAAQIHNFTTPEQRQAAMRKLKGWEDDLRLLAADAPA